MQTDPEGEGRLADQGWLLTGGPSAGRWYYVCRDTHKGAFLIKTPDIPRHTDTHRHIQTHTETDKNRHKHTHPQRKKFRHRRKTHAPIHTRKHTHTEKDTHPYVKKKRIHF